MITRDEALARIASSLTDAGLPAEGLADVMAHLPDEVVEAVMEGGEIEPVVAKGSEMAAAIIDHIKHRHGGHLPGCDGNHDDVDDFEPRNGIILTDDPAGETHMGAHGLANAANLIKTLITFVAMEDLPNFLRWMREREDQGKVSNLDGERRFSDDITPRMLAWLALSIRNTHDDCGHGGGGIPEAFRKQPDDEVIIDPRQFRYF